MQYQLKSISTDALPRALAKAERYRLLNEPRQAESICLDALALEPDNQDVLRVLLLTLTDQFGHVELASAVGKAEQIVTRLHDEYDRYYYAGIIYERQAHAMMEEDNRRAVAHYPYGRGPLELLRHAMTLYERAEAIRPPGNDDALLRWNTCARILDRRLA